MHRRLLLLQQLCAQGGRCYVRTLVVAVLEDDARVRVVTALSIGIHYRDCLTLMNVAMKVALRS